MPYSDTFLSRHLGPRQAEITEMLHAIGSKDLDQLVAETVPTAIRLPQALSGIAAMTEAEYLTHIQQVAHRNQLWKTYIGMGYYGTITPPVILRNIFENPGWYTQYTPYQSEIAQGRLEALLNFQTMVSDLCGMEVANASLLDEPTAAAEAMLLLYRTKNKSPRTSKNVFLVADNCLPATIDVLLGRAKPLGIEVRISSVEQFVFDSSVFACLLSYPAQDGAIHCYTDIVKKAQAADADVVVAADLLSLALLSPPGEWGADIVVGSAQRFGVPMGYGGPHAAFFATKEQYVRQMPGRIIGVSIDRNNRPALRMTLQTREQHIRRDKATSNICTAQALLAIMASMYGVYHGARGIRHIAERIHRQTATLAQALEQLGYAQRNDCYFDTLLIDLSQHTETSGLRIRRVAEHAEVNFRYFDANPDLIGISLDETTTDGDVQQIIRIFAEALPDAAPTIQAAAPAVLPLSAGGKVATWNLWRNSTYMTHQVFNAHRSETEMLRYIKQLEAKDLSLVQAMIPLGSCTMKLNGTAQLMPVSLPQFAQLHPYVPIEQAQGYQYVIEQLSKALCEITGFAACSLQPNSGAQGEYAGLMAIRAYHISRGDEQRNIALIPSSAHGTNPASAVIAGMEVVVVKCDENGNIALDDLEYQAQKYADRLAALMVTYPSTHGVFEERIKDICAIIHRFGGQVYMDGANMNAQVGLTSPANIGADVCHLNLHKTFAIPHGGGGPGVGPICVAAHLAPHLPSHPFLNASSAHPTTAGHAISGAPYGSASILLVSYAYTQLLGSEGMTQATRIAILNANYIKSRLKDHYPVLYSGEKGRVAHELIIDLRPFKTTAAIEAEDIAKRLMDYGFHAPTVSFPVAGTLMIEPTESESKAELDRFCEAMIAIRHEIRDIELGLADDKNNVLKNAPHPVYDLCADDWDYPYTRQKAGFALPYLYQYKFWVPVARINNTYGDRNLMCTCPPIESYQSS
ncbi:MAG: aminomethyl-transferring glycine dehydrogenase [Chitinophagales bacterium]|nr:aminomethyl-transferring glycine dehydrogenase [Chitinophagales bacterium]